jgi:ADP-ribosylglycohydrolase
MADKKEILSRVVSSFKGLSTGDAVGKQTETLSREDILKWYPEGVKGFHGRIGDVIPRYVDGPYKWRIGETTDDTEQSIAVAKAIIKEGRASHSAVGKELLLCKKSNHPSLAIWRFQQH